MSEIFKRITGLFVVLVMLCSAFWGFSANSYAVVTADDLSTLVTGCSYYRSSCWTNETWFDFAYSMDNARDVLKKRPDNQTAVNNAYNSLMTAKNELVHKGSITSCKYCLGESSSINSSEVVSLKKVSYDTKSSKNTMDLYLPCCSLGSCGLIVYIHGGAWTSSSNSLYSKTAYEDCLKYGVATAAINYRYASETVDASDILDDIEASVAKAKEIAAQYELDLTKLMLTGQSAGGHLSMLYAYTRADVSPVKPVCMLEETGSADFTKPIYWQSTLGTETVSNVLSWLSGETITDAESQAAASEALKTISPLYYIDENSVPTVICHGKRDLVIDYSEATDIANALEENGVPYELITFKSNHATYKDAETTAYAATRFAFLVDKYLRQNCIDEDHDYSSEVTPRTCTKKGYTTHSCSKCGRYYISDIEPADHNYVTDEGYPATCTQDGLTDGLHCSLCNTVFTPQTVIEAKGHQTVFEETVPATYTNPGVLSEKCTVCGEIISTQEIPALIPCFSVRDSNSIVLDNDKTLLKNVPQGTVDLSSYFDLSGCVIEVGSEIVGTGTSVKFVSFGGDILARYNAVVGGDATGDGYVDAFDLAVAGEHVNTFTQPEDEAYMSCIDLCEDGYLDANDLACLICIVNFEND